MKKASLSLVFLAVAGMLFATATTETDSTDGEMVVLSAAATQPPWIASIEDNRLTDLLEETFNFEFDFTILPLEGAKQQINLLLTSGRYPSVFMNAPFVPADELEFGVEGKVLIPLNAYLTEQQTPHILSGFREFPKLRDEITVPDGNIYVLTGGGSGGCYHCSIYQKFWINQAWLDALGLDMPATPDEYRDVLRAFKTQDPNGNGKQDEVPLTGATNGWYTNPIYFIGQAFVPYAAAGSGTKLFGVNGTSVYFPYSDGRWKDALTYLHGLFEEGSLDLNAFVQTGDQLSAMGGSSEDPTDVVIGSFPAGGPMVAFGSGNKRAEDYSPLPPLTGPTGIQTAAGYPFGTRRLGGEAGTFSITDKASDAEIGVAMQIMDWAFSFEGSNHVTHGANLWRKAEAGEMNVLGSQAAVVALERPGTGDVKWEFPVFFPTPAFGFGIGFEGEVNVLEQLLNVSTRDVYEPVKDGTGISMFSDFVYLDPEDARRVAQISAELRTFVEQQAALFITGERDLDSGWDAYVNDLVKIGLPEATAILQATLQ